MGFRSLVLLTAARAQLRAENVKRRITRWTGLGFGEGKEAENFIVGGDAGEIVMAKLDKEHLFLVNLLDRPYWETEDPKPYVEQAEADGNESLAEQLTACRGAVVIDSHLSPDPGVAVMYLAKLAAAVMEKDTPVLVVPASLKADAVRNEMRSALGRASELKDLLPYLLNFQVLPVGAAGEVMCTTLGMKLFDLPNVVMRSAADDLELAATAVQSVAAYVVQRKKRIAVGDTVGIPSLGELRVVEPDESLRRSGVESAIALAWEAQ
ncbi:MAG: DUF4261 domain-containing protein [Planctomycetota bacterium]|jgi:hypothetical protein